MARACETRALLLLLMLCEGVMRCGQCSSAPHFLGGPQGAAPHHTNPGTPHWGWGDTCPCKVLNPAGLFPLRPHEWKNRWFIKVKYKLSLIVLFSMTQVKMTL